MGHGGGLPGFGSYMAVAAGLWRRHVRHGESDVCGAGGADQSGVGCASEDRRTAEAGTAGCPLLTRMRDHILNLWKSWDDSEAKQIAAMNLFLDIPAAQRKERDRAA